MNNIMPISLNEISNVAGGDSCWCECKCPDHSFTVTIGSRNETLCQSVCAETPKCTGSILDCYSDETRWVYAISGLVFGGVLLSVLVVGCCFCVAPVVGWLSQSGDDSGYTSF